MPKVPIIMPQLGESIAEATIVRFCVEIGDTVETDQEIIEVETNKAVMGVTTPCAGKIENFSASVNEAYPIGTVLGYVEASVEDAERLNATGAGPIAERAAQIEPEPVSFESNEGARGISVPIRSEGGPFVSPRVRARIDDLGWSPPEIELLAGTGKGGRVTARDLEKYLAALESSPTEKASAMRLAVSDSMRRSWARPLATAGVALPLDPLLDHRKQIEIPPGPALYVAKALAVAISEHPRYAARLAGDQLILPKSIDIGIAVEVEDGIIVPVIRNLDQQPISKLGKVYQDLVSAARTRRLPEEAREGSIASVTNFGPLGITWATPIPLPTETLIVGLGRGEKRPVWDEAQGQFKPILMAELTVTFDHRIMDGGASGRLIQRMMTLLAEPENL
jgi:pyruvate/2-oxoglutarate dehydrogenase complex dihydrolipoamide acyltransferase (E2) component